jgi:hypothetical protein
MSLILPIFFTHRFLRSTYEGLLEKEKSGD